MSVMPIGRAIAWLAAQAPTSTLLTQREASLTREQFHRRTNRLARAYAELGVQQGDFVTVALPNGIEFFEACVAAWKLGATPQPISSKLPALERDAILQLARPSLCVGLEPGEAHGQAAVAAGFVPDPSLDDSDLPDRVAPSLKAPTSGGSTGRPKLIVSAQRGEIDPSSEAFRLTQLVPGPLYHNAPFVFSMLGLLSGGHLIVMERFDAEETLQLIERHRVEFAVLVPTMMQRIYRLGPEVLARYDVSSLERILHLAAPCPAWLKEAFIEWLGPERVHELYAGTEAQIFTTITGTEWLEHRGSVGKPRGGAVRICDSQGRELPVGEIGEIFMLPARGTGSTYRYIGAKPRTREGWESLGDMGYLDADGYLYLVDRRTDMIVSGGANVYPAEVEAAIDAFPGVRSSAVVGLPDEDLGQRVHAVVDMPQGELDPDALRTFLAQRLVRYKIPRSFEQVREPLRDDAGKLRRSALRAERMKG